MFLAFNHRGDLLASQGWEGVLRLWDPRTGQPLLSVQTDAFPRFSADDRFVGIGQTGRALHAFEVEAGRELRALPGDEALDRLPQGLSFDIDGRLLVTRTRRGVQFWDSAGAEWLADIDALAWSNVQFEADGTLLTFGPNGLLRWPVRRGPSGRIVGPPRVVRADRSDNGGNVATSLDGQVLVVASPGQAPLAISGGPTARPRPLRPQADVRSAAVSPDGRWAATVSHEGTDAGVFIWDVATGRREAVLDAPLRSHLRFSPDGRWLATSMQGCRLWEVGTWTLLREFDPESRLISFSPDGTLLASCAKDRVRLYDPATGRRLATFETPGQGTENHPAFSPDGRQLAMTADLSHAILIWDLALIRSELATMGLDWGGPGGETADLAEIPPAGPPPPLRVEVRGGGSDDLARMQARHAAWLQFQPLRRLFSRRLDRAEDYHERSHRWESLGQWRAALADAERACEGRKDDAHWVATVARDAYQVGEDAKALAAMRRALELKPADAQTDAALAWALLLTDEAHRDPSEALERADRLLRADPANASYRMTRALALARLGRDAEAEATTAPGATLSPVGRLVLSPSYHRTGRAELARRSLDEARAWRASGARLTPRQARDVDALIAEAQAVLAGPARAR